jgi:sugar phosphate isomerase/epimerase
LVSRRDFLGRLATGIGGTLAVGAESLGLAASPLQAAPSATRRFTSPLGLELYSLRNELAKDIPATLAMVRKIGYTRVEIVYDHWGRATEKELRKFFDAADLKCTSAFYPAERFMQAFDQVVEGAQALGVEYLICGNVPGAFDRSRSLGLADFRQTCILFDEWASKLRAAGLRFAYHNHDYEFRLFDGKPAYDTLIAGTSPGLVDFEMDVFWVKCGGQDPIVYLKKYPDRFRLIHLKDIRKGTPLGDFSAKISDEASVILGTGILDLPAILREARVGIELYYVEDESAGARENIRKSFEYMRRVRF